MKIDIPRRSVRLDPRDPKFFNNPYPAYQRLRESVPTFKWENYGYWCFTRHEDVAALLRDRRFGRQILHVMSREELGWAETPRHLKPFYAFERHSLLETEPPVHTRLRGLVNRAFLSRAVERLRPRIMKMAHELVDSFAAKREIDLLEHFATPIPIAVICELLGVPRESGPQLLAWSHDMVAMYQARRDEGVEYKAVEATLAFSDFIRRIVNEKRSHPGGDLLSRLIAAVTEGKSLSEDELVTTAILLLNAGHEATVHSIGNGVKALLESEQASPNLDEGHIEELLRFDAPLHIFTRYALEDVTYNGLHLRRGESVGLILGAANRDPDRFADAERFDSSRSPNLHVSFGGGIHFCVGAPLARLELKTVLPLLFERLPRLRIAEPPRYRDAYHFHGLERLLVAW
jgi:cytochrome P450